MYKKPSLTADVFLIRKDSSNSILLVKRKNEPYKNCWSLVGGFLEIDRKETLQQTAKRELQEETGIKLPLNKFEFATISDTVKRDPRDRVITAVFYAEIHLHEVDKVLKSMKCQEDEVKELKWFDVHNLPRLAFDHKQIVEKIKVMYGIH